jgi:4-amino-4-deoxy-L-arabinose transferase-like glycosyltransferase
VNCNTLAALRFVDNAPVRKTTAALSGLAGISIVLLALAVRLPALTAGFPYMNYIDEGNFLRPVSEMLREGRWEPGWYMYPSLPLLVTATAARLYDPFRRAAHGGRSLRDDLRPTDEAYDDLSPELLLAGRVMSLLAGLGIVGLAGRLARRLAGSRAGWAAALVTALAPPLVTRGAIASVDPYAAFFVLAALLFAERLRTAGRPGREALFAGAMAGFAFAAKYPAVLVALAPAWIVLRSQRPRQDKMRLLLLGAAGTMAAACLAMPGLLLHPRDVLAAIERQGQLYGGLTSPAPLWKQALVRAEWDVPYEHPELGAVFLLLVLAGLVLGLRDRGDRGDRDRAPSIQGWCLYAVPTLLLFSFYSFHPFRNLLPLVAPACILVAILWDRLRVRLARPLWADAAALLLLAVLFARPVAGYAWERLHLRDSRTEAVDWLAPRVRPGDAVLVIQELAILPGELDRLPADTFLAHWPRVPRALGNRHHRFLIASVPPPSGRYPQSPADRDALLHDYEERARFGDQPTPEDTYWWHGNRQTILILERRAGS